MSRSHHEVELVICELELVIGNQELGARNLLLWELGAGSWELGAGSWELALKFTLITTSLSRCFLYLKRVDFRFSCHLGEGFLYYPSVFGRNYCIIALQEFYKH